MPISDGWHTKNSETVIARDDPKIIGVWVIMAGIDWQSVITSLGGNAVLLAAIGWLIKALISNRFVRDAERFKIELKLRADTEIERVRALLTRASRVHEQQVDTLRKLFHYFSEAQGYMQRMAAAGRVKGELSVEQYSKLCVKAIKSAHDTFLKGRLLIPFAIVEQCDQFFTSVFAGQRDAAVARDPMVVDALQRAAFWDKAKNAAYDKLPNILQSIEKAARSVIHGEPLR